MVVGADHRGRGGVGVWRDAATGPLTARRQRARSRLALLLDQADGLAVGPVGPGPAGAADHRWLARRARIRSRGWGQWCSATASSSLLERPRRSPSRSNAAVCSVWRGGGHRQPQPVTVRSRGLWVWWAEGQWSSPPGPAGQRPGRRGPHHPWEGSQRGDRRGRVPDAKPSSSPLGGVATSPAGCRPPPAPGVLIGPWEGSQHVGDLDHPGRPTGCRGR
jgi:hypothetical protein